MKPVRKRVAEGMTRPPMERMLLIHQAISRGEFPNCRSLAATMEVSAKTILRDIEFMRDRLNMPIAFSPSHNGYHYTEAVENFPLMQMTEGELVALFVAEQAIKQYRDTPFASPLHAAFEKLTRQLTDPVSFSWSDLERAFSFRPLGVPIADVALFQTVSRAVLQQHELEFHYRKLNTKRHEPRRVQPYHLACIESQWYLFAYDLARASVRTFVLSRMRDARDTGKRFSRPTDFSIQKFLARSFGVYEGQQPKQIRLRFDPSAAQLVQERIWHPSQRLRELPDGALEMTLELGGYPEVLRWVLSWGDRVEALEPPEFRELVRQTLENACGRYRHRTRRPTGSD
ncbi:MAG: WYL domain-containing protein [Verrucomicrobiae bacterium]|nr:WYL domain-containing protein [Verrucomicrobiae bacterium]